MILKKKIKFLINKYNLVQFEDLMVQSFWSVFGALLSRGSMLISAIVLTRILDTKAYGQLGILRSTLNFFVVFAGFGLGNTASKYISLYKNTDLWEARRIFDISLLFNFFLASVLSLAVFVFAKEISIWSFNDATLSGELRISAFLLFFATMNGVLSGSLAGFQEFKKIAKNTFLSAIIQTLFSIIGGCFFGVSGALIGFGLGYFFLFIAHKIAIDKCWNGERRTVHFKDFLETDKTFLWSFSLPTAFSSFIVMPVFWWGKTFLIKNANFEEMAAFDVADQWRLIILFVPTALMQIVLPALTLSKKEEFIKKISFNIKLNLICTLLVMLPVIIFSKNILSLYGKEYVKVELFIVLILSALFSSVSSVMGLALASKGKMWIGFLFNLFWAFYFILLTTYFIGHGYKATGLAYAMFWSYLLHVFVQFVYFKIKKD